MKSCSLLNVDKNEIVGTCDDKCKFVPNYKLLSLRMGVMYSKYIQITSNEKFPVVTFNGTEYLLSEGITIQKNTMHNYNDNNVGCELKITHTSIKGDMLIVAVPILKSNRSTKSSNVLKTIVNNALIMKPNKYEIFKNVKFNPKEFIPTSKMVYYNASIKDMQNKNVHIVTFHPNTNVTIDHETFGKLNDILSKENDFCFNNNFNITSGLYSNETFNPNTIINSNLLVSVDPIDEEREEDRKIKRKIKEELRDINYRANLNTNMKNDTMENANVISENIGDNIEKSIAKLISNSALSVDDSDKIEGFTIEGMFCDSPNEEQSIKFVKYTMGFSLIASILYVGSKVFLNKD